MERPPKKAAEEVSQSHGTAFVLRKKGQEESSWAWKRKSMQGHSQEISLSYRRKVLSDIKRILTDVGGLKLLQQFVDGCFGHLLRFIGGTSCNKALHELISREIVLANARDDELWFRIGKTNIRFAPAEYALVTGLCFGSSSFDTFGTHDMPPNGVFNRFCSGQPVSIKELWRMFNQRRMERSPEDYLKVAHVLVLNLMVLGYDLTKTVERWVWVLVDDLDAWNKFPWGAYAYQALMHYISNLPRKWKKERRRYHFPGPVWAIQIWAYEAIPCLGQKSALVTERVTIPRCLNWSFPSGKKEVPKHLLERKLDCFVTLEPTDEEKRQPYWLSVQTEQPLGVQYASGQGRKQGRQGTARPRRLSIRIPIVESTLGEPDNLVEVLDSDDSVSSDPEPSARPSHRQNRNRASKLLDEERFVNQVSSRVVDKMIKPMAEEVTRISIESMLKLLIPHLNQHVKNLFQARELDHQTENPGDCARADEKKETEKSFDGGSSSLHNSRKTVDEPSPGMLKKSAPEDAFGSEEQCEVPMNDPRLDVGVAGNGKSFANQEDFTMPNEDSRLKRGGPIRALSDATEKAEMRPPRAGEADEPELLADPSSSKQKKKKKLSSRSKHMRQSPSSNEESSDDEGSESFSANEKVTDPCSNKATKKKKSSSRSNRRKRSPSLDEETSYEESSDDEGSESSSSDEKLANTSSCKAKKKKKSVSRSKHKRQPPSSDEESSDDEGSASSSGDERRRKMKKRAKRKTRNRSESSSSESSDSDRHRAKKKKQKRRRASSSRG